MGSKELSTIAENSVMENLTLVDNNSYLFKGTVRENLSMGNLNITEEEMNKALKKVNLFDFLESESGSHEELLSNKSIYDKLYSSQQKLEKYFMKGEIASA